MQIALIVSLGWLRVGVGGFHFDIYIKMAIIMQMNRERRERLKLI